MATWIGTRNLLTTATVVGGHAEVAGFPKTNILQPERPYKTVRTPSIGVTHDISLDLGAAAVSYQYVVVANKNYQMFEVHTSSVANFASDVLIITAPNLTTRCPWNTRYMQFYKFAAVNTRRYVVYRITGSLNPTTFDGAAYYSTGGLWIGTAENLTTILGRSWKWAYTFGPVYPELKIGPSHNGWSRTIRRGNPRATLTANLEPDILKASPGGGDGLARWIDLQRRIRENYFCAVIEDWDPAHALICEDLSPPPVVDYPVAQVSLHFEEAV
jgi:hypothetical protein